MHFRKRDVFVTMMACSYDYEPESGILTFQKPSPVHRFFKTFLANEIRDQLRRIADKGGATGEFAAKVEDGGSSRILLEEGISGGVFERPSHSKRREPDGQFQHHDAAYPGVVLEIAYLQDSKNLRKLASDYKLRSNGDIKAVISLDINY